MRSDADPVLVLSDVYGRRMKWLNKLKNDELERQVDVIGTRDPETIRTHYERLRSWQVRISDQEAWNFGAMELLVLVLITAFLLITGATVARPLGPAISSACTITSSISCRASTPFPTRSSAWPRCATSCKRVELGAEELEVKAMMPTCTSEHPGDTEHQTRHRVVTRRKTSHVA